MYKVIVIDDEMLVRRGIVMETDSVSYTHLTLPTTERV